jgi:hypothetical protein
MLLNGPGPLNGAPLNDVQQPFNILRTGAFSDTLTPEDTGKILSIAAIADGNLTVIDAIIKQFIGTHVITVTEALGISESVLAYALRNRLGFESVVTLDQSPLGRFRGATFSELLGIGDASLRSAQFYRRMDEVLALIDEVIGVVPGRVTSHVTTETISVSDDGRQVSWDVLVTASLSVVDELISSVISAGGAIIRVSSDSIILTDGHTRALLRFRSLLDAVVLAEGELGKTIDINATFTETLDIVDEFLSRRLRTLRTEDGVTLIDILASSTSGNRVISSSDAVFVGDSVVLSRFRGRTAADVIGLSDAQLRAVQRLTSMTEAVTFSDDTLRVLWNDRRLSELLGISDDVARTILYAILYDVRPVLRAYGNPFVLSARETFRLGAH